MGNPETGGHLSHLSQPLKAMALNKVWEVEAQLKVFGQFVHSFLLFGG